MKVDFKKLTVSTIDWTPIVDTNKLIGNAIYLHTKDLNLVEIARKIYNWEEVDIAQSELDSIKEICNSDNAQFAAFVKKWVNDFVDWLKKS